MCRKLYICSSENEDWNGEWLRCEVEKEMAEVDIKPTSPDDWVIWILDHVFDCKDFTGEIEKAICNEAVRKLELVLDGYNVKIEKIY